MKFNGLSVQIAVYFEGIDCSLGLLDFVNYLKKVHIANSIIEKQKTKKCSHCNLVVVE
jgi:hypothetical protein